MKSLFKILIWITFLTIYIPNLSASNYNIETVRNKWLEWTNSERSNYWIKNLTYNAFLNSTSQNWSDYSKTKWYIDHKRPGQMLYYDYKKILSWFGSKGVNFKKINSATFSESIWWEVYRCNKKDCTQDLISSVRKTFNFYMKEKWKKYSPHYSSIIGKNFNQIWLWISIDDKKWRYYLTVHYATEVLAKK
ncbi:MAG: hypothetical protein ACD_4C00245G0003 [uncultured bacterium (gcode 4)]|uniref:SCP domain-containing protein n=1 Tax=uncultured bacterium (gcode 4) TaxID=1234023 RepID=K2G8U7_9BACT|nr:MAG: hypothetical protein ACD_4C00245G0003 [uncultured bacterium (gcode 4)]